MDMNQHIGSVLLYMKLCPEEGLESQGQVLLLPPTKKNGRGSSEILTPPRILLRDHVRGLNLHLS